MTPGGTVTADMSSLVRDERTNSGTSTTSSDSADVASSDSGVVYGISVQRMVQRLVSGTTSRQLPPLDQDALVTLMRVGEKSRAADNANTKQVMLEA